MLSGRAGWLQSFWYLAHLAFADPRKFILIDESRGKDHLVDGFSHEMSSHHEKEFVEGDILSRWARG
jgi:hypothetical protein